MQVETVGGDGSEKGLVMKKWKKNLQPVQPHHGLQG